jgi:TrmH family RNA methyltransferase
MGSRFRLPAFHASLDALTDYCDANGIALWAADGEGEPVDSWVGRAPERLAIVVGNEGSGVSSALAAVARHSVAIPVRTVESLNVAIATAILLYALRR